MPDYFPRGKYINGSPRLSALPQLVKSKDRVALGWGGKDRNLRSPLGTGHLLTWVLGSDHDQKIPVGTGSRGRPEARQSS